MRHTSQYTDKRGLVRGTWWQIGHHIFRFRETVIG